MDRRLMPAREKAELPLWRRVLGWCGVDLRQGEGTTVLVLFVSFFGIVTFQYMAKTVRQSLFIDAVGATALPYMYLLVAVTAYPVVKIYFWASRRASFQVLMRASSLLTAASMVGFWFLFRAGWSWVPAVFYLWISVVFVTLVSQFWTLSGDVLDPRQARRLFGLLGAGGLLGSIAGGQIARLVTSGSGVLATLPVAAMLMVGVALLLGRVPGSGHRTKDPGLGGTAAGEDGLRLLWTSSHLRMIAVVLLLSVMVAQAIDLQFNWAVEQATSGLDQRVAWYGNFFSAMGVAAFLFQILLTARIHTVLGMGVAVRVLPMVAILGSLALLGTVGFFPEALVAAALTLKLSESGLRFSLDQSTRELLYMPVPSALRARGKALMDLFLQRFGKGLAALFLLPVSFGWISPVQVGWQTLAFSVAWLLAAGAVTRTYVQTFRAGLRDNLVDVDVSLNLADVKTMELLVQALGSTDTRQVLHSLELLQANHRGNLVPPLLLYHDDAEVRRRTLVILASVGRKDTAPLVERCLADEDPEVRAEAIRVLTHFHTANACSLMRPRLREGEPRVRAAAVTCLVNHGSEEEVGEAGATLLEMLQDADPGVRAEGVKAMGAVHGSQFEAWLVGALDDPAPVVASEAIHAVQRVVARDGFRAVFLPRLISHLQNRRLKAHAREAIVAFGQEAIEILVYFLNDRDESIFVRRSLPRILARIDAPEALAALLTSLLAAEDAFLRGHLVEALASRKADLRGETGRIEEAMEQEARRYLTQLANLVSLADADVLEFQGPVVRWDRRELNLLVQMVAERLEDHLKIIFGMLALVIPSRDAWAAHGSLLSGRPRERARALEFLDNTLSGIRHRVMFAVIDDVPLAEKLRRATRLFDVPAVTRVEAVGRLLADGGDGDADARALAVAALYTLYTDKMESLYPYIGKVLTASKDPLVLETAGWVQQRLSLSTSGPGG